LTTCYLTPHCSRSQRDPLAELRHLKPHPGPLRDLDIGLLVARKLTIDTSGTRMSVMMGTTHRESLTSDNR
jgi:hypothetical protein